MDRFEASNYGPKVASLLSEDRLCAVGPGRPNKSALPMLEALQPQDIISPISDVEMASCCLSGLWLWHDFLDRSHEFSQEIPSQSGSYWHAIMHRREPDYSNSKYWYRRVGDHEIFPELQEFARELAVRENSASEELSLANASSWDPYAFVDLCSTVARGRSSVESFCREVARREWLLLFDYCFQRA